MIDPNLLTTTCAIFRPFGAAVPLYTDIPCRMQPDLPCGRGSGVAAVLAWSHYMDLQPTVDILDQCGRGAGSDSLQFNDGDQVNSPSGASHPTYVVVFVVKMNEGTSEEFKRVYLLRDTA